MKEVLIQKSTNEIIIHQNNKRIYVKTGINLRTGLIAVYDFEETSGAIAYDNTPSSYNLTIGNNVALNQTGILSKCFNYNASTTAYCYYNSASNNLDPISNHSIAMWVKRLGDAKNGAGSTTNMIGTLISKYWSAGGYRVYFMQLHNATHSTDPNKLSTNYWDSANVGTSITYVPASDIWTNNWNHIVYTRAGSSMNLYINGDNVASLSGGNGSMKQQTATVRDYIGALNRSSYTPDQFFNGLIDQTAIWNIELTQAQVTALYNGGSGLAYTNWY
jgi:hypothetical protein